MWEVEGLENEESGFWRFQLQCICGSHGARCPVLYKPGSLCWFFLSLNLFFSPFLFFFFGFLGFGSLFAWRTRGVAPVGVVGAVDVVDINGALRFGGCGCSERWGGWIRG